jgi:hypothetical protein
MTRPIVAVLMLSGALAQAPAEPVQPVATMKQLMLDVIYPASNSLLLQVNRGGPSGDNEWGEARRSAMTLAESGNLLIMRNRAPGWVADAKLLIDVGAAAFKAADARDARALTAATDRIDASCTACHKQFRTALFPPPTR